MSPIQQPRLLRHRLAFPASITLLLLTTACSVADREVPIYIDCDSSFVNTVLENKLGFPADTYTVLRAECNSINWARGTMLVGGSPVDFYYGEGHCSSGGYNCGWDLCLRGPLSAMDVLLPDVRSAVCPRLRDYQSSQDLCSSDETYDRSGAAAKSCYAGAFDIARSQGTAFSIHQVDNSCCATPHRGHADCLSLASVGSNYPLTCGS